MPDILIDADACPVKEEVYRVAKRYGLKVTLAANSAVNKPPEDWINMVIVNSGLDAADDWIVGHTAANGYAAVKSGDPRHRHYRRYPARGPLPENRRPGGGAQG